MPPFIFICSITWQEMSFREASAKQPESVKSIAQNSSASSAKRYFEVLIANSCRASPCLHITFSIVFFVMEVVLGLPLAYFWYILRCIFCHGGGLGTPFRRFLIHFPFYFLSWRWSWDVLWEIFDAFSVVFFGMSWRWSRDILGKTFGVFPIVFFATG